MLRTFNVLVLSLAMAAPWIAQPLIGEPRGDTKKNTGNPGAPYTITTVAGNGKRGFSGDDGPATDAKLAGPCAATIDAAGNIYIADYGNHRIRKVNRDGIISTFAGTGERGFGGDEGPAVIARLNGPYGVKADKDGNIFVADQRNDRIRKISPKGIITTVAGNGLRGFSGDGGPATQASLSNPNDILADAAGNLIIADAGNHRIRKMNLKGEIFTIAGSGERGFEGDGGPALKARLHVPSSLAWDAAGNLFIGDFSNHAVRKLTPDGIITTVAGVGRKGFNGNGIPAKDALFNELGGVAVDAHGQLLIADGLNYQVRRVDSKGLVHAVAGTGKRGYGGDNGPALETTFSVLDAIVFDDKGNLYVTDHGNNRIRKLTPSLSGARRND